MDLPFPLILGTTSKYRLSLFREHFDNIPFSTLSPSINERAITAGYSDRSTADPSSLTLAIAHAKADALLPDISETSILLTSDQVVVHNNRIREKPADEAICRQYLKSYQEHPLQTVTAIVITRTDTKQRVTAVDTATQYFTSMPNEIIEGLIKKGEVMYCAGGITVEDELLKPVLGERIGTIESIMGLPVTVVRELLQKVC